MLTTPTFDKDELDLALQRVERDHEFSRVFVSRTSEWLTVRYDREGWLRRLGEALAGGSYSPSPALVADVPKGRGAVRSACLLSLVDEVVYTAAVGKVLPAIESALKWSTDHPDCSYLIREPKTAKWLSNPFYCFDRFRKRSVASLVPDVHFVVIADVTGYYDAIAHETLLSDLLANGADATAARYLVGTLLGRWAMLNGRGIPQGLSASDLLAKLYLNTVDRALAETGIRHLRYVDDFRIFTASIAEARKAQLTLQTLARRRGLALQSAKTDTLRPDKARALFEGIQPVLAPLAKKFIASIAAAAGISAGYLSPKDAAKVLAGLDSPPTDLLRDAYTAYVAGGAADFNKTLFHYLLGQLGRSRDPFAAAHAVQVLIDRPEETDKVLDYLARVDAGVSQEEALLAVLRQPQAIYAYQHYQYLRWRLRQAAPPSEGTLRHAREVLSHPRSPGYLVAAARMLLGRFGSPADLEQLKADYATAEGEGAKVDIVCALYRLELTQRNAFLGGLKGDGAFVVSAIQAVKTGVVKADLDL